MSGPGLSCIVPAFNEAPRITRVLEVALQTDGIDEVIVVDDGSSDGTAEAAEALAGRLGGLRVLRQPQNGGKTRAVARGVAAAEGGLVLFLDSDLEGLTAASLDALIAPVAAGAAEVSISLRQNAPRLWHWIGLDYISGERVMPRAAMVERLDALDTLPRFGLEVWMNRLWIEREYRLAVVHWPDVVSPLKAHKQGVLPGAMADVKMIGDIFATVGPVEVLRQIGTMRSRRV